jgi:hypothetical protein
MTKLTQTARDALPDSAFGLPETRSCPMQHMPGPPRPAPQKSFTAAYFQPPTASASMPKPMASSPEPEATHAATFRLR